MERARSTFLSGGGGRHAVVVDLPVGLLPVMADRRRIVQVLNNLISNAARHAPESTPIRVVAVREDAHVAVSVSDEGSGVAPERLPHLFSKHAAAERGAKAGHGLGLAISKGSSRRTAAASGPRAPAPAAARRSPSRCRLPVRPSPRPRLAPPSRRRRPEPGEPPRILVMDDDPQALRFVRDALSEAGYAPLVTGTPRDLPRIIRTEKPRLVLLDLGAARGRRH